MCGKTSQHPNRGGKEKQTIVKKLLIILATVILTTLILVSTASGAILYRYNMNVNAQVKGHPTVWKGLHVEGKWIVDSEGNVIILHGANFMGYEFGSWDKHAEEDYARMASWGFNVVRLPIAWQYIEPQGGIYNSSYFTNYVDRDIQWARKYGLYIILDMHQGKWSSHFGGNGAPAWLVDAYPQTDEGKTQAKTDFWENKAEGGVKPTLENPSMQDRFITMWKYVASRYANEPTIAGYDLFNEPYMGFILDKPYTVEQLNDMLYSFYGKLISEIRKVDSNHILIYESTFGGPYKGRGLTIQGRKINERNVVFSLHFYHEYDKATNRTQLKSEFDTWWWGAVKDWGIPIWVGEFGVDAVVPNAEMWVENTVSVFNEYKLGWVWWTYWKSDGYTKSLLYADGTERIWVQYLQ